MKFNKLSTVSVNASPLYSHVESLIRDKILRGQLEPGEKLPCEEELANQLGVSLITIRTALSHLCDEGLIVRNRPKGTFVTENIPVNKQFIVTGGVHEIVNDATRYNATLLGIDQVQVGESRNRAEIRKFLNLTNDETVGVIKRVRLLKETPILYLENFIPIEFLKYLTKEELSKKPLLKILKEKAGLTIGKGEMYIEAVPAEIDVAEILRIQVFSPLILMRVYYWFSSGEPFEIVNLFMRSEYFKYKVDLDVKGFENI